MGYWEGLQIVLIKSNEREHFELWGNSIKCLKRLPDFQVFVKLVL